MKSKGPFEEEKSKNLPSFLLFLFVKLTWCCLSYIIFLPENNETTTKKNNPKKTNQNKLYYIIFENFIE